MRVSAGCLLTIAWIAWLAWLAGCPADDEAGLGDDEVGDGDGDDNGDTGAPEAVAAEPTPIDPLFGDAPEQCGTSAHPKGVAVQSPTSLGNGLVHDSRLGFGEHVADELLENSASLATARWSEFVDHWRAMSKVGFRPAQLRVAVTATELGPTTSLLQIRDQSIYISDDDANYLTEVETYLFADTEAEASLTSYEPAQRGARPISIASFVLPNEVGEYRVGHSLAWIHDDAALPWKLRVGRSRAAIEDAIDELAVEGYRPISVSSRSHDGVPEYAAIFVADGVAEDDWQVTLGLDHGQLGDAIGSYWQAGFYPYRITAEQAGWRDLNVLWIRRPLGLAVEIRLSLTLDTFAEEDALRRAQGYHLETLDRYQTDDGDRHVAVWVRYAPCMRWVGTRFAEDDPDYQQRYAMFHEQTMATMTLAGTKLEGRVARPSATLHIFEGDQLVLNRAYTFAPTIYPNTEIDAAMKLASVSKSITAAAVVKAMAEHALPLTTPYTLAAGLPDAPATMADVTVLDVLRNLGGFRAEAPILLFGESKAGNPISYTNHTIIDMSPYGALPITGEEMFDYVVFDGHLDTQDADSYWDRARYDDSQISGTMHYSNPGYSMLGELVATLSGTPYPQYVVDELAAPLGLDQRIFADPGHRRAARGPTLAGLRTYLSSEDHAYRFVKPGQAVPATAPLFGAEPTPAIGSADLSATWRICTGPLDSSAPEFASYGRYSGLLYMGGAPLAAGGWHADGEALGLLIRSLGQDQLLMPSEVARELWSPHWKNDQNWRSMGWSYGLGWYLRGNWVVWAGGTEGAMATVAHNRAHDFTVVHLANVRGNGLDEFLNPLMDANPPVWDLSAIGQIFPCIDEELTFKNECETTAPAVPY